MANYGHIIIFSLLGGVFSLVGGAILLSRKSWADKLAAYATPFAAGALLAAVFLDLLHEGVERAVPYTVLLSALIGMILFFFAERFLRWFHHHHGEGDDHTGSTAGLIIAGDTLHNALDGIAIAASFLVSVPTGIVATIAVAAHEIPQEIGDFGLLLKKGLSRKSVLLVNALSALATLVFALLTFWIGSETQLPLGVLLGLSAGFLLYIAASDVIPTIHDETPKNKLFDVRPLLLVLGAVTVGLTIHFAHGYIDTGHDHGHSSSSHTHGDADGHDTAGGTSTDDEAHEHSSEAPVLDTDASEHEHMHDDHTHEHGEAEHSH